MQIGIFTIIKDEQAYLEEWLAYHLNTLQGISKIYVFEDIVSKSHKYITDKYNKVDCFRLKEVLPKSLLFGSTKRPRQVSYMYYILDYIKSISLLDWVFYIDIDEFITLQSNQSLQNILYQFSTYDILMLSWKNYNANGHIYKPKGGVLKNYTQECNLLAGTHNTLYNSSKLCFNLSYWNSDIIETTHHYPKKANWCRADFSKGEDPVYDKIFIRHFITKSLEEFCNKIFIRGQFYGSKTLNSFFCFNPDINKQDPSVINILCKYIKENSI